MAEGPDPKPHLSLQLNQSSLSTVLSSSHHFPPKHPLDSSQLFAAAAAPLLPSTLSLGISPGLCGPVTMGYSDPGHLGCAGRRGFLPSSDTYESPIIRRDLSSPILKPALEHTTPTAPTVPTAGQHFSYKAPLCSVQMRATGGPGQSSGLGKGMSVVCTHWGPLGRHAADMTRLANELSNAHTSISKWYPREEELPGQPEAPSVSKNFRLCYKDDQGLHLGKDRHHPPHPNSGLFSWIPIQSDRKEEDSGTLPGFWSKTKAKTSSHYLETQKEYFFSPLWAAFYLPQ